MNDDTTTTTPDGRSFERQVVGWRKTLWRIFGRHQWEYRNPYDRTCKTCGRLEVAHCWPDQRHHHWWEVFRDGDEHKHYESHNTPLNSPQGQENHDDRQNAGPLRV